MRPELAMTYKAVDDAYEIHNPNFKASRGQRPGQNSQLIRDPPYFPNPPIRSIHWKNP